MKKSEKPEPRRDNFYRQFSVSENVCKNSTIAGAGSCKGAVSRLSKNGSGYQNAAERPVLVSGIGKSYAKERGRLLKCRRAARIGNRNR